jgi:hypothetical protein
MPGEIPFFIEGKVAEISPGYNTALVRVPNGNVYQLDQTTPGINFNDLTVGKRVVCEVTTKLTRVFSARIID